MFRAFGVGCPHTWIYFPSPSPDVANSIANESAEHNHGYIEEQSTTNCNKSLYGLIPGIYQTLFYPRWPSENKFSDCTGLLTVITEIINTW